MPQFDQFVFLSQIFWFTIIFIGFYFIFVYFLLPPITLILKTRLERTKKKKEFEYDVVCQLKFNSLQYIDFLIKGNKSYISLLNIIAHKSLIWTNTESKPKAMQKLVCQNFGQIYGEELILQKTFQIK